jgi:erythronate-4-phosphate dehydrogenase
MVTIVADEHIPFLKGVLDQFCRMEYLPGDAIRKEHLLEADGLIIRTRTRCDKDLLEGTPIRFIATATIGLDHIDTQYCDSKGISYYNAAGCNAWGVYQYVAAALVHLAAKHHFALEGMTLGVVGAGHVGSKVVKLGEVLGMKVLQNDPPREREEGTKEFVPLDQVVQEADILTLHVPLNPSGQDPTFHLVNEHIFHQLKKQTYLINTSRGPVVDSLPLINSLRKKDISGCILDVWENEPNINLELLKLTDIATPHIAGYSIEGKANGTANCVREASQFFGFGIGDWYPTDLPGPSNRMIKIADKGKPIEYILSKVISATYNISTDDALLRESPGLFEQLRNNYPARREFPFFKVILQHYEDKTARKIQAIGFSI